MFDEKGTALILLELEQNWGARKNKAVSNFYGPGEIKPQEIYTFPII